MPTSWLIRNDTQGVEKLAAVWGINSLKRMVQNQANDTLTFVRDGGLMDSAQEFNYGDVVIVTRDSVRWFYGLITKIVRTAAAGGESLSYEVSGPFWYLQNLIFEQVWATPITPTNPSSALTTMNKTRVILNQSAAGAKISTGAQIFAVVNFAISKGAPIQIDIGDINPAVFPRFSEVLDQNCAEIINQQLRWSPDCVVFFDYTATPYPRLYVRSRPNMSGVTKPLDSQLADGITITPRHDLQLPGVRITYETSHSEDEVTWSTRVIDSAGADTFGTAKMTVELGGSQASNQRQSLVSAGVNANSGAFWIDKNPWLAAATGLTVTGGSVNGSGPLASELTDGAIPPWLPGEGVPGTATAFISYTLTNAAGGIKVVENEPISANFTKTTLMTGSYSRLSSFTPAEAVPTGVAAAFFASAGFLHYEGSVSFTEEECYGDVRVGMKLNLTGGLASWGSMEAMVQQVSEDIDSGTTQVSFGPPGHISITDFIELIRVQRGQRPSWRLQERVDGKATGGKAESEGPKSVANTSSSVAAGPVARLMLAKAGKVIMIDLDVNDIPIECLTDLKVRVIDVCDGDPPVAKKMAGIFSAPWTP